MSVTRLLVLGAVRIFQPTHGYFVRRELTSWQVADWAHLNPGSIYNALRGLAKEGLLIEEDGESGAEGEKATSSRNRTLYRLTVDGETEFQRLVRKALWELHPYEPGWLFAGASFWFALSRDEVTAALEARASLLRARLSGTAYTMATLPETAAGAPTHVVEHFYLLEAQVRGELAWVEQAGERIRGGAYGFRGEDRRRMFPALDPRGPMPQTGVPGWREPEPPRPTSQV